METNNNTTEPKRTPSEEDKQQFIEELDVVKQGFLHIKRPPTNIKLRLKTWQLRYIVLRDNTKDRGSRLEICSSKETWADRSKRNCDKYILDLRGCCLVTEYRKSKSFPFSFILTRKGHSSLILGAETEHEVKQWMCAINLLTSKGPLKYHHNSTNSIFRDSVNDNVSRGSEGIPWHDKQTPKLRPCTGSLDLTPASVDLPHCLDKWIIPIHLTRKVPTATHFDLTSKDGYLRSAKGFPVSVHCVTARNPQPDVAGDFFLEVTPSYVVLQRLDAESKSQVIQWPLVHIRKFKCEDKPRPAQDLLTLEAGCHCDRGEGTYQFKTNHGRDLVILIRDAMRKLSLKRKEHEEKLQEMRSIRRLRQSMRAGSDSCLQNKMREKMKQQFNAENAQRSSSEDIPNGAIPYYLTLLPDEYGSSTPDETSSDSDTDAQKDTTGPGDRGCSGTATPDQLHKTVSGTPVRLTSGADDLPPVPPPRPRHTLTATAKPLPPLPNS